MKLRLFLLTTLLCRTALVLPQKPFLKLGDYNSGWSFLSGNFALQNNKLYIAGQDSVIGGLGLIEYDFNGNSKITKIKKTNTFLNTWSVEIIGNRIYVSCDEEKNDDLFSTLLVFDTCLQPIVNFQLDSNQVNQPKQILTMMRGNHNELFLFQKYDQGRRSRLYVVKDTFFSDSVSLIGEENELKIFNDRLYIFGNSYPAPEYLLRTYVGAYNLNTKKIDEYIHNPSFENYLAGTWVGIPLKNDSIFVIMTKYNIINNEFISLPSYPAFIYNNKLHKNSDTIVVKSETNWKNLLELNNGQKFGLIMEPNNTSGSYYDASGIILDNSNQIIKKIAYGICSELDFKQYNDSMYILSRKYVKDNGINLIHTTEFFWLNRNFEIVETYKPKSAASCSKNNLAVFNLDNIPLRNMKFNPSLKIENKWGKSNSLFTLYPNPTSGHFKIKTTSKVDNINIYDSNMKLIFTQDKHNELNTFNINKLGIYFIELSILGKNYFQKIIVN